MTIHDPCIQFAARLSIFTQVHEKSAISLFLSPDENLTKCTFVKWKNNFLFNSDALLTKRGYKHDGKTITTLVKSYTKRKGRSNSKNPSFGKSYSTRNVLKRLVHPRKYWGQSRWQSHWFRCHIDATEQQRALNFQLVVSD